MIKTCNKCGLEKLHSTRIYKSGTVSTQSRCVDCQKIYKDQHYQNNKKMYASRLKERRESMKRFVRAAKSFPCTDCNITWPYYVMQYDHTDPSSKLDTVSRTISNRGSWKKVVEEIMKCELVCANCHFIRTHNRS